MRGTDAANVLRNLVYRPGWSFDAMAYEDASEPVKAMFRLTLGEDVPESIVLFRHVNETVDTNKEFAADGYREPKVLEDTTPLDAADFEDREALLFAIFNMLMRFELHESQEFFRCKDQGYEAPFHPHKAEGRALWDKCESRVLLMENASETN